MKKIFFPIAAAILLLVLTLSVNAASVDDLTFTAINNNTEYEVWRCNTSATGDLVIPDTYEGKPVTSIANDAFNDCRSLTSIIIPDGVTSIGDWAFSDCTSLTSITIPDSVTSIGGYAFCYCENLTSITIPDSVTSIGSSAFSGCKNLIKNENGVHYVGKWVVGADASITSANIKNNTVGIGDYAFSSCYSLTSIIIPDGVTSIGEDAFYYCISLTSISVDENNKAYHSSGNCLIETATKTLIRGCNTSVIPDDGSVMSIGNGAFNDCRSLTSIIIPDGVTSIGGYAFYSCASLTSITIPDSVTSIGDYAFYYCTSLTDVYYSGSELEWSLIKIGEYNNVYLTNANIHFAKLVGKCGDNVTWALNTSGLLTISGTGAMYDYDYNAFAPWHDVADTITSVKIEEGVTSIGEYAFDDCESLTSISIPSSITSMHFTAFGCSQLKTVTIDENNPSFCVVDGVVFTKNKKNLFLYPAKRAGTSYVIPSSVERIYAWAFKNSANLTSITIPDSVTWIGDWAFDGCTGLIKTVNGINYVDNWVVGSDSSITTANIKSGTVGIINQGFSYCTSLTAVNIPDGVKSICTQAFVNNTNLKSITIPDSVTLIESRAFYNCTSLTDVYYSGSEFEWRFITINQNNECLTNANIHFADQANEISGKCGDNVTWKLNTSGLLTISGTGAMYDYQYNALAPWHGAADMITSVKIEEGVTSIGIYAFRDCTSLTSITIPNGVTSIGNSAFNLCTSLTSIIIPDSVTSLSPFAFQGCNQLTTVTIAASNPTYCVVDGVVFYKDMRTLVLYPANKSGTSYEIPSSVKQIAGCAFYNCTKLTSITIPDSVVMIGGGAFRGCTNLFETVDGIHYVDKWVVGADETITTATIKDGTVGIVGNAFTYCKSLKSISIPGSVKYLSDGPFYGCTSLIKVVDGIHYVDKWVVDADETITTATIKDDTVGIADYAFRNCTSLTSITIPNGVTNIAYAAFVNCTSLTSISIPSSVTSIGSCAFERCTSLTSISIPSSVTSIEAHAFYACTALTDVYYQGTERDWKNITIGEYGNDCLKNANIHFKAIDADTPTITISDIRTTDNETVNIKVELLNNPGIVTMSLTVNYDTAALELVGVTDGGILGTAMHGEIYTVYPYTLYWSNPTATADITANGTIATLSFKVKDGVEPGVYPITISYDNAMFDIINKDFGSVDFTIFAGEVEVIDFIYGDVDDDGLITNKDSAIVARYLARWSGYDANNPQYNLAAADVDCDGQITNKDSAIIARHLARWAGYEVLPKV